VDPAECARVTVPVRDSCRRDQNAARRASHRGTLEYGDFLSGSSRCDAWQDSAIPSWSNSAAEWSRLANALHAESPRHGTATGALYHHFSSKHDLFRAVFEDVEAALLQRTGAEFGDLPTAGSIGFWDESMRLFVGYLDAACDDAAFRQIVLIDGPAVLGWESWREIQAMLAPDSMETWPQNAIDQGLIAPHSVSPTAHLLVAAMNEAVMYVAHAPDPAGARSEVAPVVRTLFEGLRLNR
jgi:AcrR family transcriptional regulator